MDDLYFLNESTEVLRKKMQFFFLHLQDFIDIGIMKINKCLLILLGIGLAFSLHCEAQQTLPPEIQKMQQTANHYLQQRDFANSIMLFNQAINQAPDNVSLRRDLAYTYYLSGKAEMARTVISPVLNSVFADEQTFQVAAAIENVLGNYGKAKRILKSGIKKYPHSGLLYNNLGNLYSTSKSDKAAMDAWREGILKDPGFGQNYYGAARMYYSETNYVWALIYGEIYLNLDPDPSRSNQIKKMIIETYQALLSNNGSTAVLPAFRGKSKEETGALTFEKCFQKVLLENASIVRNGLNPETLTMLRTRFLMDWELKYAHRFPFTLFAWQNKLIHTGYFDAYNQWLFGAISNSQAFQLWVKKFSDNYSGYERWVQRNPLQPASYDPQP